MLREQVGVAGRPSRRWTVERPDGIDGRDRANRREEIRRGGEDAGLAATRFARTLRTPGAGAAEALDQHERVPERSRARCFRVCRRRSPATVEGGPRSAMISCSPASQPQWRRGRRSIAAPRDAYDRRAENLQISRLSVGPPESREVRSRGRVCTRAPPARLHSEFGVLEPREPVDVARDRPSGSRRRRGGRTRCAARAARSACSRRGPSRAVSGLKPAGRHARFEDEAQPREHAVHRRIAGAPATCRRELFGTQPVVAVEKRDQLAPGGLEPAVPRVREPVPVCRSRRTPARHREAIASVVVGRAPVDEQDLQVLVGSGSRCSSSASARYRAAFFVGTTTLTSGSVTAAPSARELELLVAARPGRSGAGRRE